MCPFNFSGTSALALATEGVLKIGTVESIQKLHIKKIPLGETPRRIAYQESTKTFGLLSCKEWENEGAEFEAHYFKVLDEQTFDGTSSLFSSFSECRVKWLMYGLVLDIFKMDPDENIWSIKSATFANDPAEYFVVGTAYVRPAEDDPSEGRILVFTVTETRKIRLVCEVTTDGAVYALGVVAGNLVACVNGHVSNFWSFL